MSATITCYPIFVGRRATALPNTFDVCYILLTNTGQLYRRQCTQSNGNKKCDWVSVNITGPFVFYDVCSELVCLVGFTGTTSVGACPTGTCPTFQTGTYGAAAAATYGAPVSSSSGFAPATSFSNFNPTATSSTYGTSAITSPTSAGNIANILNSSSIGISGTGSGVIGPIGQGIVTGLRSATAFTNAGQTSIATGFSPSFVNAITGSSPNAGTRPILSRVTGIINQFEISLGALRYGASQNGAIFTSGHGSTAHGVTTDGIIHAIAPGSVANGVTSNATIQSQGHGSTASGAAANCGKIVTGGEPVRSGTKFGRRFFSNPVVSSRLNSNFTTTVTNTSDGTTTTTTSVSNNYRGPDQPLTGSFSSQVCLGPFTGDDAAGTGNGSNAFGFANDEYTDIQGNLRNSGFGGQVLATGDGSFALGVAKNREVHQATEQAAAVIGRANQALAPYSLAIGRESLAYMYGSFAQSSFSDPVNRDEGPRGLVGSGQQITVLLRGETQASPIYDATTGLLTGYTLITELVTGDTPRNPVETDPNTGTTNVDLRPPFLPFNGAAIASFYLLSPRLVSDQATEIAPPFGGLFIVGVSRTTVDNQTSHNVSPAPGDTLTPVYQFPASGTPGLPIVRTGIISGNCDGFSLVITETVPLNINPPGQVASAPNPRINGNIIQGRSYTATLVMTMIAASHTEVTAPVNVNSSVSSSLSSGVSATATNSTTSCGCNTSAFGAVTGCGCNCQNGTSSTSNTSSYTNAAPTTYVNQSNIYQPTNQAMMSFI